jgi:hypothetical protein
MAKAAPASENAPGFAPFPPALGQIGTLIVITGALIAQLSAPQLHPLATGVWLTGLLLQVGAIALAVLARRHAKGAGGH